MSDDRSTVDQLRSAIHPVTVWLRRLALLVLAGLIAVDLTGRLGLHTAQVEASDHGYDLSVKYPAVARAGLDVVWQMQVHHPGGFGKQIILRVTGDYADILENQGYSPQPSSETADADWDYLTFDAPDGDTFSVDVNASVQPSSQQGKHAEVQVLDADGNALVTTSYRTRLLP